MAKFKNLVDHLRQKRLEGVVSVEYKPVNEAPKIVKEKNDVKVSTQNATVKTTAKTKTTNRKRKGK